MKNKKSGTPLIVTGVIIEILAVLIIINNSMTHNEETNVADLPGAAKEGYMMGQLSFYAILLSVGFIFIIKGIRREDKRNLPRK